MNFENVAVKEDCDVIEKETINYDKIAKEIRELIINRASKYGGPFGSNLGSVEIIIALCKVYDFKDKDKIVFDIGQQYQAYKILTGRKNRFFEIGRKGGLSRYPDIKESPYDHFSTGHSGTSASAALGYAVKQNGHKSIAFFGDGSLTSGEIYEALNHAGELGLNYLAILNQNDWSIDKNVGALADGLTVRKFAESLKFEYIGILEGHDTPTLIKELEKIKKIKKPVFLHIRTIKGKGYKYAEEHPAFYHFAFYTFDIETGQYHSIKENWLKDYLQLLDAYSKLCEKYIEKYDDIYFTSPAYLMGGLRPVAAKYPKHVIDTGINEQHCMTFSSSLRLSGSRVIMSLASFFMPRCYDQIFDLCAQKIPMVVMICFPGIRPSSCWTHQGTFDISAFRTIPNLSLLHPKDIDEFRKMMDWSIEKCNGPVFVHATTENCEEGENKPIAYGKGEFLTRGNDATIVPIGSMFKAAYFIKENIPEKTFDIFNPRFLVPFDYQSLIKSVKRTRNLIILEDGIKSGGVGEGILSHIKEKDIECNVRLLTAPNKFVNHGTWGEGEVFEETGMTNQNILREVKDFILK